MIENPVPPNVVPSPWRILWWVTGIPAIIEWFK